MVLEVKFGVLDVNVVVTIKNEMQDAVLIEKIQALEAIVTEKTQKLQDAVAGNKP